MTGSPRERILATEAASAAAGCPAAEKLAEYREKSLTREARAVIERHVASCEACAEALRFLDATPAADGPALPMDVEARSEALLREAAAPPRPTGMLAWPRLLQAAAAVVFVVALGVGGYRLFLAPTAETDMGELRGRAALELIEPAGRIAAPPQELRWVAHPLAASYRVTIYDEKLALVWIGDTPDGRPALALGDSAQAQLQGRRRFVWQVYALDELGATVGRSPAVSVEVAAGPTTSR